MKDILQALKTGLKYAWEIIKMGIPSMIIYASASSILMMLTMKEDSTLVWDNTKLLWTILCWALCIIYNVIAAWSQGAMGYDMLFSGNMQRRSAEEGSGIKISKYNELLEYRTWKGFAVGFVTALPTLIMGLVFGANESAINGVFAETGTPTSESLGLTVLLGFFIAGWTLIPCFFMNGAAMGVSYYLTVPFILIPVLVTGFCYIAGAYGKRNKALREADRRAAELAQKEAKRTGKINYGGLPGTQPKKRK
jgi:hypothetical protein